MTGEFFWMYKFLDKSSLHPDLCNFIMYLLPWEILFEWTNFSTSRVCTQTCVIFYCIRVKDIVWICNFLDKSILHSDLCNFITYLLQRKISIECKKFLNKSSLHPDLCIFILYSCQRYCLNLQCSWQVDFALRFV